MKHSELTHIALRALAYAELAAARDDDVNEVLALLMQAVADTQVSDARQAVLRPTLRSLDNRSAPTPAGAAPAIHRGSMHYV